MVSRYRRVNVCDIFDIKSISFTAFLFQPYTIIDKVLNCIKYRLFDILVYNDFIRFDNIF